MEWLQNNWIWIALAVGMIAFHIFGHGGHRHGKGGQGEDARRDPNSPNETSVASEPEHAHADPALPSTDNTIVTPRIDR